MQAIIRDKLKNIEVTSVTLANDKDDPNGYRLHMFFCPNCQNPIAQYKGIILSILPGMSTATLPIIVKCSNCGKCYSFQDIL